MHANPVVPTQLSGPEPLEEKPVTPVAVMAPVPMTPPEPVEDQKLPEFKPPVSIGTLLEVSIDPTIAQELAKEGLQIDNAEVNRLLLEMQQRENLEAAMEPTPIAEAILEDRIRPTGPVTRDEFEELRDGINASFEEVANLLLETQRQIDEIEARLTAHNRRGGHKI